MRHLKDCPGHCHHLASVSCCQIQPSPTIYFPVLLERGDWVASTRLHQKPCCDEQLQTFTQYALTAEQYFLLVVGKSFPEAYTQELVAYLNVDPCTHKGFCFLTVMSADLVVSFHLCIK